MQVVSRADGSKKKLAELNPYVAVGVHEGALDDASLAKYQVIVVTDTPLAEQKRINAFCHQNDVKFIAADIRGVFATAFVDFGDQFNVFDVDGEPPVTYMIDAITNEEKGTVTVTEESRLDFRSEYVKFSEVEGMVELNEQEPVKIEVLGNFSFTFGDTRGFSPYKKGGYVTEVKQGAILAFKTLEEALAAPRIEDCDFKDLHQRHIAFLALHSFREEFGRLPAPYNVADAEQLLRLAQAVNAEGKFTETLDEDLLRKFSFTAMGNMSAMAAFLGGVVGQEVLKACTGKFTPIRQFLYFDAIESLPENVTEATCKLVGFPGCCMIFRFH